MFKRSLSWFILVFTLLEFVVRTQLTAYDNSHGFISNSHDRFLADEISSMQEELASDIRSATINKLNMKLQLKFDPEFLDFKQRPLGIPHLEKVTLFNVDRIRSIDMTSISGNTVHFHSSFFEDKKIPPLGNTTFRVVFLGREEGAVESNLFIHTTEGHFKYHVKGASIYSPYRLRPIVGVKLPVNATFSPTIHLYNPHLEPIQVVEIYSSGGDFHLELPTGELEGPKDIWEIPPLQTKAIIKIRFLAKVEQNHTAYVRIKLNNTDDYLVVPLEVEVTSEAVLFAPQAFVDFGVGGSLDPVKEVPLNLSNPLKRPVRIQSITTTSRALRVSYEPGRHEGRPCHPPRHDTCEVAVLKLDWKVAFETSDFSGKIVVRYRNGAPPTEIPYYVSPVEGGLTIDPAAARYFVADRTDRSHRKVLVRNDFLLPVALVNVSLPEDARKFFHISGFKATVLRPQEEKAAFGLKINPGVTIADVRLNSHVLVHTNISDFRLPLVSFNGKFELRLPYKSKDNSLDLGLVGSESRKDTHVLLLNRNPIPIEVRQVATSLPSTTVEILGCARGDPRRALLQEHYKNITKCMSVKDGEYAILKFSVKTGRVETQIWGDISVHTQYEQLSIPVHFKVAHGKLEIGPDRLVFDQCFPGKICSHPLRVHSTFSDPMVIEDILNVPPDPRITSKHSGHITARATKIIGHLYLDPMIDCQNECYLGLQDENRANWRKTLQLTKSTTEFDLNLVNVLYNRYLNQTSNGLRRWQNLTMRLDTSEVKGHLFKTRVKMSWPSLLLDQTFENKTDYAFPLTQVGNVTYKNITIKNPSSYALLVQIILDKFYPGLDVLFEGLPPVFLPGNPEEADKVPRHSFFLDKTFGNAYEAFSNGLDSTVQVRLKPNENFTIRVGFRALDSSRNAGFIFLRNNLTVLEVLRLSGKGAFPNFKFGNRKPGSSQALAFELTEKHLKECEFDKIKRYQPVLTIKRSFTARNTGDVPVYINGFFINSLPCEGYGFKVLNCEAVVLPPNGTKKIDIAFTPDFTLAKITRTLILDTSLNFPVNYTLVTTVPSYYLPLCSNIINRPNWENHLYYISVLLMVVLLIFVAVAPMLESERIVKEAFGLPRQSNAQHTLNLRMIGAQTRTEMQSQKESPEPEKKDQPMKMLKLEEEKKYAAVVPATGKGKKKGRKGEPEGKKKSWAKAEEKKKKAQPKVKEAVKAEEETSSTTTESSNNEEVKKEAALKPKAKEELEVKLERKKSLPKTKKENKAEALVKDKPVKLNKKERKQNNRKLNLEKSPKTSESPNSVSPTVRLSPAQSNLWTENKASFSDVVARSETIPTSHDLPSPTRPITQVQPSKPTMYVEPYKQTNAELGPIGPRKLDAWQEAAAPAGGAANGLRDDYSFFRDVQSLAAESSQAFLDINSADSWQPTPPPAATASSLLNYIQGNQFCGQNTTTQPQVMQDSWGGSGHAQPLSHWDSSPYGSGSSNGLYSPLHQNGGYLWGSSPVWQWTPPEQPRTPTRTPPGFAPHREEEEKQRRQQTTNALPSYNLYHEMDSSIWSHQQRNPWNYPQEQ